MNRTFSNIEKQSLMTYFESYCGDVKDKVILLKDENGLFYKCSYKSRFTNLSHAIEIAKKFDYAFEKAKSFNSGISP